MLLELCTQELVEYSSSLLYNSQILALKAAEDSLIQFSSTFLYFNNHGTQEDVFFVLLLFTLLKHEEQLK